MLKTNRAARRRMRRASDLGATIARDPGARVDGARSSQALVPLGALAAGFGFSLCSVSALAQTAPAPAAAASSPAAQSLPPVVVRERAETDANSVRATTTTVGRGNQDLKDVPQSTTVVTRKLIEDRRADTVKEALQYTAGISFLAAEGGEEDIRLRGFSLTASGDIYIDNVRDPAFYERDLFNFERIEVLRGSASMLFGRGSTGGIVNQVSKQPLWVNANEVSTSIGNGGYVRFTGDFNQTLGENVAVRLNAMRTQAENYGDRIDTYGIAPTVAFQLGKDNEISLGLFALKNDNGIHYGLPWLRQNSSGPISATNPGGLVPINPRNYYSAASDYARGDATYGTFRHSWKFDTGSVNTTVRHGNYSRDQRAGTLRFCVRSVNQTTGVVTNPECNAVAPDQSTLNGDTTLTRGSQIKIQELESTYVQTDVQKRFTLFGQLHNVLGGIDLAREEFENYGTTLPAGVVLNKNSPRPTIGNPDDGTAVDEGARIRVLNRTFVAKALGVYAQDLFNIVPTVKALVGLRWDKFSGDYKSPAAGTTAATERSRSDSLWSKRGGLIWQPDDATSVYASYGTSFNTSGELYNYDAPGVKAPPEKSRNIEVGAKRDFFSGNLSTRVAVFRSTKYNERNRDSPEGQPIVDFILSGERHASGMELDLAGRITPAWEAFLSYAWIPSAKIDKAAFGVAPSGEREGDRPSLTPRHTGSVFTTYQLTTDWRFGGGVNARSTQTPNRNPVGIVAPGFLTYDLLAEYAFTPQIALKLNVVNLTNKHYADSLYTAHYIPGQARTVYATVTARF